MISIKKEFAFFNELELFNQFVYQLQLEGMKKQPTLRDEFYQIWMPFYMESQLKKLTNEEEKKTNARKRKRKAHLDKGEGNAHSFLISNCLIVRNVFEKFRGFCGKQNEAFATNNILRNNEIARHCVKMAPVFQPFTPIDTDLMPFLDVQLHSADVAECSSSHYDKLCPLNMVVVDKDNGTVLHSNPWSRPLSISQWIFPPTSSFLLGDVAHARHFLSFSHEKFDLIVADPPWQNRTVKRQRTYQMFKGGFFSRDNHLDRFGSLPIPELLTDTGLFCIWLSNSQATHKAAGKLLIKWKLRILAHWHWLKICRTGEPVCDFRPEHKVPFETLIIACKDGADGKWKTIPDDFCIISVPNANPSRKPPISLLLQQLGFICPVRNGLELYARYLLPNFTSIGFEATKFQHQYYFKFN